MPVVNDPNKEEEKDQTQPGAGRETIIGAPAGTITGSFSPAAPGGASAASGTPTRSGSWTNLQSYVTANKGADKGLGQRATTAVKTAADAGTAALDTFRTRASSAIDAGTHKDPTLPGQILSAPQDVDPNRFRAAATASYTGPKAASEVQGYNDTQTKGANASGLADQLAGSHADRAAALARRDVAGRDSYTLGERNLDSFLLGAGSEGRKAVDEAKANYGSGSAYKGAWELVPTWFGLTADTAARNVDNLRADVQSAYDQEMGNARGSITRAQERLTKDNEVDARIAQALREGDRATWVSRGLTPQALQAIQELGIDPGIFVDAGRARTLGDVVDPDVAARYQALTRMAGGVDEYDFARGDGPIGVSVNGEKVGGAKELLGLASVVDRVRDRGTDATLARTDPVAWLTSQGISPTIFTDAELDPASAIEYTAVPYEGTMNASTISRWNELAELLGIGGRAIDPKSAAFETAQLSPTAKALINKHRNPPGETASASQVSPYATGPSALDAYITRPDPLMPESAGAGSDAAWAEIMAKYGRK